MRLVSYIRLLIIAGFLGGCSSIFNMQLPPGFDNSSFRSDKMHPRPFSVSGTSVLGFRVIKDSVINYTGGDTTLTIGIIMPRMKLVGTKFSRLRVFGNDSIQCTMHYHTHDIFMLSASHSLLGDIIFPPDKYHHDNSEDSLGVTYYYRYFSGSLANNNDTAFYCYEEVRSKKDIDTATITGYIFDGKDSLILKPYYLPVTQNAKRQKYIYMLEGLGLYHQGRLLAFLQYAPLIEPGHEKLHISAAAGLREQVLIAAYFTLFYDRL